MRTIIRFCTDAVLLAIVALFIVAIMCMPTALLAGILYGVFKLVHII